jgi:plasmid maintenance system antidote protein VapI
MSDAPERITDVLRRTICDSGVSYKALSRETGVARASIQRFVDGRQSIRLDMADRLATYFGLNLVGHSEVSSRKNTRI